MAASTLRLSDTYLGAQFRRFRTRLGAPVAIKAMAAKLARLVYRMLCYDRQRRSALPGAAPAVTDQAAQQESREPGISTHPSSSSLKNTSFWGRLLVTYLDRSLKGPRL